MENRLLELIDISHRKSAESRAFEANVLSRIEDAGNINMFMLTRDELIDFCDEIAKMREDAADLRAELLDFI